MEIDTFAQGNLVAQWVTLCVEIKFVAGHTLSLALQSSLLLSSLLYLKEMKFLK